MKIYLNDKWFFTENVTDQFLSGPPGKAVPAGAVPVRIPHTVRELPYNYFDESLYQMLSGYSRKLFVDSAWKGKTLILHFEAVAHSAYVSVNGTPAAEHHCGYTAFEADVTNLVRYGEENDLRVLCDSRESQDIPPFGFVIDYMTYGGIYRDVWLEVKDPVYLKDCFVKPVINGAPSDDTLCSPDPSFSGVVETEIRIAGQAVNPDDLLIRQEIRPLPIFSGPESAADGSGPGSAAEAGPASESAPASTAPSAAGTVFADIALSDLPWQRREYDGKIPGRAGLTESVFYLTVPVKKIRFWSPESPALYQVTTKLFRRAPEPVLLDEYSVRTGFRQIRFDAGGFYLNGKKYKLRGLNRHQSYPYTGYAMPDSVQQDDADILKFELGLNAVRTSHYPQSQAFVDRCDEIGLLVFTEIPGWQHIGGDAWKTQAVRNTVEMVEQYRNHPSIFLWGVRINESLDDDAFYELTNMTAHALDPTRPTGGVRYIKNSHLLEDVYTYNDFSHSGANAGCEKKRSVTSDPDKGYLISEYNGHMYPTKAFDSELHRAAHLLRHARVLNDVIGEEDIAGCFGWCMADYNTHRDFGSGDRICYHGVLDMFRNPKPAAAVYASFRKDAPVLELTSRMEIGEHPAGNIGEIYAVTNAEKIRMYKNDVLIREYDTRADSAYPNLPGGPVPITDFIGECLETQEHYPHRQAELAKDILNHAAIYGFQHLPPKILTKAGLLVVRYGMKYEDAYALYSKYVGSWGDTSSEYRFEAVTGGKVVKTVTLSACTALHLCASADHTVLTEGKTYDVAAVRLSVRDQNGNVLPFYQGALSASVEGPASLIGPSLIILRGGLGGTYLKTTGEEGPVTLTLSDPQLGNTVLRFEVKRTENLQ